MRNRGILHAFCAYFIWGLVPIFWKFLSHVPASQLIGHRIVWSFILLAVILLLQRKWPQLRASLSGRNVILIYSGAAVLCGLNWFIYVWAVTAGYILEASLGYFISPLLSVLLGVVVLRERLRPVQWFSIVLAGIGVTYLAVIYGRFPLIALSLALTFGFYGLVKKKAPLNSFNGLTLETGILFLPGLAFLFYMEWIGKGAFLHSGLASDLLMAGAGLITTIPLLFFASATQRIPLTTIGIMHYITPTLQFLLGVLVYHEAFSARQAFGYGIVWASLIIFCAESFRSRLSSRSVVNLGDSELPPL
jgi:chloramphenicol-sensitive protein RarD